MRYFLKRFKDAWNDQGTYNCETLYFKIIMCFLVIPYCVFKAVFIIIAFVTVPLWILPYMIYCAKKGGTNER